jgi:hypothetical protein
MSQSRAGVACGVAVAMLSLTACTREILPTGAAPEASPEVSPASVPSATPTPVIVSTPAPSASPAASSCPTLLGIRVTIFASQPERDRVILDATPLTEQCQAFPGRLVCPLGQPGTRRREECEAVRIGEEGPEWTIEPYGQGSVEPLDYTGGYLAAVVGHGLVTACSRLQPDLCANFEVR